MNKKDFTFSIRDITEIGILVALALVLDTFVKIPVGANGGSINIAMVPLFLIALHKGWFKGLIAGGIVFGLLSCLIDGYGFVTYPFDYFIGFGSVVIVGFLRRFIINKELSTKNYFWFGVSIVGCMLIRFIGSLISGIIIYDLSVGESALYQLTYLGPTLLALLLILLPCLKPFNSLFSRLS